MKDSTIPQRRAQQIRSLLGSVGAANSHAYSASKLLEEERKHDPSMKTSLNRIVEKDLMNLRKHLTKTEQILRILNDHYRNYPKPTLSKWEKSLGPDLETYLQFEAEYAARQQNLNSTSGK